MQYTPVEKLTVGQYQALHEIYVSPAEVVDKTIASISLLTGMAADDIENLPIEEWQQINAELAALYREPVQSVSIPKYIELRSGTYAICKISDLRLHEFADLRKYIRQGIVPHLHDIAVCVLRPVTRIGPLMIKRKHERNKKEVIAEDIRASNFIAIHALCVYFVNLWNFTMIELRPLIKNRLANQPCMEHVDPEVREILEGEFLIDNHYPVALNK